MKRSTLSISTRSSESCFPDTVIGAPWRAERNRHASNDIDHDRRDARAGDRLNHPGGRSQRVSANVGSVAQRRQLERGRHSGPHLGRCDPRRHDLRDHRQHGPGEVDRGRGRGGAVRHRPADAPDPHAQHQHLPVAQGRRVHVHRRGGAYECCDAPTRNDQHQRRPHRGNHGRGAARRLAGPHDHGQRDQRHRPRPRRFQHDRRWKLGSPGEHGERRAGGGYRRAGHAV